MASVAWHLDASLVRHQHATLAARGKVRASASAKRLMWQTAKAALARARSDRTHCAIRPEAETHASLHRPPPARARTDAAVRQPHRLRVDAAHPGRRHRPDAGAERYRDRPGSRSHRGGAGTRPARLRAVLHMARQRGHRRLRPLAVEQRPGHRATARDHADHVRIGFPRANRRADGGAAHRRVLRHSPGYGRRLHRALVLAGHARGARLLARHPGHGVPVGVVAVGAPNWSTRRSSKTRSRTSTTSSCPRSCWACRCRR